MRLLIIEDNKSLADLLEKELKEYVVQVCYTGNEGEEEAYVSNYEAIILDLNLPGKNGLNILRFLRENDIETPVLILTAQNETSECAAGLNLGADDYLTKPFELIELRARLRAIIRRNHGKSSSTIVIGNMVINQLERSVQIDGEELELTPKEFDILSYLAEKFPKIVSSEELIESIYNDSLPPDSSVLRVHLSRLKKKLNEKANSEKLRTIHSRGYVLCK